ncbi:hypothetical protein T06_2153 [Trichinella sp. T6]|nr:hypothetical protein T06_2153 [Trichinella sp. T6]
MLIIDVDSIRNSPWVVLCQNIDGSEPVVPFTSYSLTKAENRIRSRFYRSGMSNDIQVCYRTCKQCAALKKPLKSKKAPSKPIGTDCPLQRLGMDFAGLRSTAGNQFTLVVVDYFTRYFGAPDQLHIDQGQSVEAELMIELGRLIQSTAYNL